MPPSHIERSVADFFLIAGPCCLESPAMAHEVATHLQSVCRERNIRWIFKSSFDKANRTSIDSQRGVGLARGLEFFADIKSTLGVATLTDIHSEAQAAALAEVVDVLQIPAFLSRQTDLIAAAAQTGRALNIKKGQFLSPWDMEHVARKAVESQASDVWLCERGASFGYNQLVVDMRSLVVMRAFNHPVVFDATHSVQLPGGGAVSGGMREMIAPLARAACAVGIDGLFIETHPDPSRAVSDAATQLPLDSVAELLDTLLAIPNPPAHRARVPLLFRENSSTSA